MTKLTPRDYIDATPFLARAGFIAIRELLNGEKVTTEVNNTTEKTISEVALTYGIDESVVELVKTTSSYSEYETISRLETEREDLTQKLEAVKEKEISVKPKSWHYAVAGVILLGLLWVAIIAIIQFINFIIGLF